MSRNRSSEFRCQMLCRPRQAILTLLTRSTSPCWSLGFWRHFLPTGFTADHCTKEQNPWGVSRWGPWGSRKPYNKGTPGETQQLAELLDRNVPAPDGLSSQGILWPQANGASVTLTGRSSLHWATVSLSCTITTSPHSTPVLPRPPPVTSAVTYTVPSHDRLP